MMNAKNSITRALLVLSSISLYAVDIDFSKLDLSVLGEQAEEKLGYVQKEARILMQMSLQPGTYPAIKEDEGNLRLMSFNVQLQMSDFMNDLLNALGIQNRWQVQKVMIKELVAFYKPAIIGFQELIPGKLDDLKNFIPGYDWFGIPINADSAFFYDTRRLTLLDKGTFWLNDDQTYNKPGWGSNVPRTCTWGKFKDNQTGKEFWLFNTHLDHEMAAAQQEGIKLIAKAVMEKAGHKTPAFIMGDWNSYGGEDDAILKILSNEPYSFFNTKYLAARRFAVKEKTFEEWDHSYEMLLDHIFVNNKDLVTVHTYGVARRTDGKRTSDHFAIIISVTLK